MSYWLACLLLIPCAEGRTTDAEVQHWRRQLREGDILARQDAADALGRLGPRAEGAIPDLVEMLDAHQVCRPASLALARIGPRAIPAVLRALDSPKQNAARLALARLGPPAVPALLRWLKSPRIDRRILAAQVLGDMGPAAEASIPALVEALYACRPFYSIDHQTVEFNVAGVPNFDAPRLRMLDNQMGVSRAAARALSKIGPKAVPALAQVLRTPRPKRRDGAAWSLVTSACVHALPEAFSVKEDKNLLVSATLVLTQIFTERNKVAAMDAEAHFLAAQALANIGPPARAAAPALLRFLGEPEGVPVSTEVPESPSWDHIYVKVAVASGAANGDASGAASAAYPEVRLNHAAVLKEDTPHTKALKALRSLRLDEAAIPDLMAALRSPRRAAYSLDLTEILLEMGRPGEEAVLRDGLPVLLQRVQQEDRKTWASASLAIELLGPRGRPLLAVLDRMLRQQKTADILRSPQTWRVAAKMGREAEAVLTRALEHRQITVRWAACLGLEEAGVCARLAAPALRRLLDAPAPAIRAAALDALLVVDPRPEKVLPILRQALKEKDADIRPQMQLALLRLGPAARELIPPLRAFFQAAVKSKDSRRSLHAAEALIEIGAPEHTPLEYICDLTASDNEAFKALVRLGVKARPAARLLRPKLKKAEGYLPLFLVWTLAHIDPDRRRDLIPALVPSLDRGVAHIARMFLPELVGPESVERLLPESKTASADRSDRDLGVMALRRQLDPDLVPLFRYLSEHVNGAHPEKDMVLLSRLGSRGGAIALPALLVLLGDLEPQNRATAAAALGNLGDHTSRIVPRLRRLLDDEDASVRVSAAAALLRLEGSKPALEKLLTREISRNPLLAGHLIRFGSAAGRVAVPALKAALDEPTSLVRAQAASILGPLGPEARSAAPRLRALLDDPNALVRRCAARALGNMGTDARAARPRLHALTLDADRSVALAAAEALRALDTGMPPFIPNDPFFDLWYLLVN